VIAGIDHAEADRVFDFTPTRDARGNGGGADAYARLIIDEVLPYLRREYAVTHDGVETGLGGSSLGGLVTLVIAATHPDAFGKLLVMSPSVWWDGRRVLEIARAASTRTSTANRAARVRLWLDVGLREGEPVIRDARRLHRVLMRRADVDLRYSEEAAGDHSERSWARRLPEALEFLFGTK
jgi:predicted alpha/beta superfamily hydrolase